MDLQIFLGLSILFLITNIILIIGSFLENKRFKYLLSSLIGFATLVIFAYLMSILSDSYFSMSFFNSLYFVGIDLTLFCLTVYITVFTIRNIQIQLKIFHLIMGLWMLTDSVILLLNPFKPFKDFAISYKYVENSIAHWRFDPHSLYTMHLVLSYTFVAYVITVLIYKIIKSPIVYQRRYTVLVGGISCVVLMNAIFLFIPNNNLIDFSVLFYSLICAVIFWTNNHFSEKGMLSKVREMVIDELGHPILLFDNENYLTMHNKLSKLFLTDVNNIDKYLLNEFIDNMGFTNYISDLNENESFQWEFNNSSTHIIYRVDYIVLKDNKDNTIGRLFMFTDYTLEYDLLTGFHTESSFNNSFNDNAKIKYPAGVAICDINCLSVINKEMGREAGDRAIKDLSEAIINNTSEDTYYVRLNDAILMFVCFNTDINKMRKHIADICNELKNNKNYVIELSIQHAIGIATEKNPSIKIAMHQALKSMKARKMMDTSSAHSSLLDSLAQTLQESDSCTIEHVKRTQIMGEKLAIRLGLSDIDTSNLTLLCLLHDIGKLGVPLEILNKPGKLSNAEWQVMRSHAEKGYRIAKASKELEDIADLILHHHECWNGKGYPDGLSQEAIPLLSRMIAVVDTYDAMTNDRPYRRALSSAQACKELLRCAGTQFDPYIVSEFIELLKELNMYSEDNTDNNENSNQAEIVKPRGIDEEEDKVNELCAPLIHSRYILDGNNKVESVDEFFEEMTGYTKEDIVTYNLTQDDLIFEEDRNRYFKLVKEKLDKNSEAFIEHRLRRKDGSSRGVFCYGRLYFDSVTREPKSQIIITDVAMSESVKEIVNVTRESAKRSIIRWEDSIRRDSLTGLLNRIAYQNDVQLKLLGNTGHIIMLMTDIDNFKSYNDNYGHKKGDELLVAFANSLKREIEDIGIVGRMGGDEFSAILCFEAGTDLQLIADRITKTWENVSAELKGISSDISLSMGAVEAAGDKLHNFNDLYSSADKALYKAKNNGKNQFVII